ncbi:flagellar hook-associated protein [Iodidimonas muriae]|uniref:Flagellar hook-associated protein 1 n=1 Tax=Iodidimonas muriae TaxID=261467 RepID=A0ABQ2LFH0_9PROT|nr:flagellar hook-associated protein FlgK [Iodidimonas muriae]GER08589.1 flagellar hook-associated protein [Kordiimonadales bacterium JCM 17843]GGO15531.1 flagellar hook-associated protein [Iodidimonas muriae]
MSLTLALSNAQSGLRSAQQQISTTSVNIANASTAGFVRKDSTLSSLVLGGAGSGVVTSQERSAVDERLLRDIRLEEARLADAQIRSEALSRYAEVFGDPAQERSISFMIEGLADSFRTLFDQPASATAQNAVLDAAYDLVGGFQTIQAAITSEREASEQAIGFAVEEANLALNRVEDLNRSIRRAQAVGEDASDLRDERDRQISALSQIVGIRSFEREDGEMVVLSSEGVTLVDGRARQIDFTAASFVDPSVTLGTGLSGLSVEGTDITPGGGGAMAVGSGKLAGLFTLRDTVFPDFQAQVDGLASGVLVQFQNADASLPPGGAGLFTDASAVHDPLAFAAGLAGRIAVNDGQVDPAAGGVLSRLRDGVAAATPGDSADSTQVAAFLDGLTGTASFPPGTGLSASDSLLGFSALMMDAQQSMRVNADGEVASRSIVRDTLTLRFVDQTGVNVDAEAQRLLVIEQAFSANARVVAAVQTMFDELNRIR